MIGQTVLQEDRDAPSDEVRQLPVEQGLDPGRDPVRTAVDLTHGQLLLMPSESGSFVGLKAVAAAPANPARGLPRIHAAYLLFDAVTLALRAIIDGTALTSIRTPAVSLAAVTPALSRFDRPVEVVAFGAGPQATGHVAALGECSSMTLARVTYVVRRPDRVPEHVASRAAVLSAADPEVVRRLERADIVVCATSAQAAVVTSQHLADGVVVIAVGSHEPHARELDGRLMGRADVIVEDVGTALREAGDVVLAVRERYLDAAALIPMA